MNNDFQLDSDGDLFFNGSGNLVLLEGVFATTQRLQTRLRTFVDQWFLDITLGVPWFQSILGKKNAQPAVDTIIKNVAENSPGITKLDEYTSDITDRVYTASLRATDDTGETVEATV